MRRSYVLLIAMIVIVLPGARALQAAPRSTTTFPVGWNLVGVPAGTRLNGAVGNLYTRQFRDGSYQALPAGSALTGGLGYWAYFPDGGSANLTDESICVVAVPIGAAEWVMVGHPWPSGTVTVRGADRVMTYSRDGGYTPGVTLRPGQAAWAYSSVATTVALVVDGCPTANSVPPSPPIPPPGS